MFQLSIEELVHLKSQFVMSRGGHGGRRKRPLVFTEQGIGVLSGVYSWFWSGPVIAVSGALFVFAGGEFFTRQRIAQQYRWDKVADIYAQFLDLIGRIGNDDTPPDLEKFMARFTNDLLLWG